MSEIIIVLGMAMLFVSFLSFTKLPKWLDFKPFNCHVCASFWASGMVLLGIHCLPEIAPFAMILSYAGISAYTAIILKRILTII